MKRDSRCRSWEKQGWCRERLAAPARFPWRNSGTLRPRGGCPKARRIACIGGHRVGWTGSLIYLSLLHFILREKRSEVAEFHQLHRYGGARHSVRAAGPDKSTQTARTE